MSRRVYSLRPEKKTICDTDAKLATKQNYVFTPMFPIPLAHYAHGSRPSISSWVTAQAAGTLSRACRRACRRTQVARPWPRRTPPCRRRPEARSTIVLERRRRRCARLQDEPALAAGPLRVEWEAVASRWSALRRAPQERPRAAADLLQCSASSAATFPFRSLRRCERRRGRRR